MKIASCLLLVVLLAGELATPAYSLENKWSIGSEPKELPKISKGKRSWVDILERALEDFTRTPDAYRNWSKQLPSIMTAYGVLQTSNGAAWEVFWFEGYYEKPSTPDSMRAIFRSKSLRKVFYNWAMPAVKKAFGSLTKKDQEQYLKIFEHASQYLAGLNTATYRAEVQYLAELEQGRCRDKVWLKSRNIKLPEWMRGPEEIRYCRDLFTWYNPQGVENPYRKIESFAFRRVREGVDAQAQKYWVDRVIADLRSVAK